MRGVAVLFAAVLAAVSWCDPRDLTVEARPLFESKANPRSIIPYKVTVSNQGGDAAGSLIVRGNDFEMRYGLDLPQGAQKQLIVYPSESMYSGTPLQFILQTNQGTTRFEQKPTYEPQNWLALAVSDSSGVAAFMAKSDNYQNATMDAYARAGALPDRSTGYVGCAVVFLGDGAERMSDTEVAALQDYIVLGGSVVVFGGPAAPVLEDPRWRPFLPVLPGRPKTLSANGSKMKSLVPDGRFTISPGQVTPGSTVMERYAGENFVVKKTVGLGRVIFVAANLLEEPGRTWEGLDKFFLELGLGQGGAETSSYFGDVEYGGQTTYPAAYALSPGAPGSSLANDPFQAKMPPTGTILLILGIYFVLVVPVNLLVLRKMGKGELAWVTSPIISLVFAGIFFRFASGLYSAELSCATRGMWIADSASPRGQFVGTSQLFFPRGGAYNLGLDGVQFIGSTESGYNSGAGKLFGNLKAIDDGQVRVPRMTVNNLSFHEFNLQQVMEGGSMVKLSADGQSVTNVSKHTVDQARLVLAGKVFDLGKLAPGASKKRGKEVPTGFEDQIAAKRTTQSRFAVVGTITDVRPGPQIGNLVPSYHRISLIAFGLKEGSR